MLKADSGRTSVQIFNQTKRKGSLNENGRASNTRLPIIEKKNLKHPTNELAETLTNKESLAKNQVDTVSIVSYEEKIIKIRKENENSLQSCLSKSKLMEVTLEKIWKEH